MEREEGVVWVDLLSSGLAGEGGGNEALLAVGVSSTLHLILSSFFAPLVAWFTYSCMLPQGGKRIDQPAMAIALNRHVQRKTAASLLLKFRTHSEPKPHTTQHNIAAPPSPPCTSTGHRRQGC